MQYVRAQKNKKNIRRILKSVENKWECASINGTVDRCVLYSIDISYNNEFAR